MNLRLVAQVAFPKLPFEIAFLWLNEAAGQLTRDCPEERSELLPTNVLHSEA
jgi:hypothetical protein